MMNLSTCSVKYSIHQLKTFSTLQLSQPSKQQQWSCLFTKSETTGEKDFEEFFTEKETLDLKRFQNLGVINNAPGYEINKIHNFESEIQKMKSDGIWEKKQVVDLFSKMIPDFGFIEKGKFLDGKM